jgi:hypothetical protein
METPAHKTLKQEAVRLLVRAGCVAAGIEVSCPIARHRVDAAGYVDALPKGRRNSDEYERLGSLTDFRFVRGERAKTVIVECKQARSDFLTDSRDMGELLAERERLMRVRAVLEEQIVKACEPQLRISGSRLFPDLEEWDFAASRVGSYRAVLNDLRRIDERMHGESKFWMMAHYRLADWLYLAAPRGVIRAREVPPGWGLLEFEADLGSVGLGPATSPEVRVRVAAPELRGKPEHRQRLLRNIAVASTRRSLGSDQPEQAVDLPNKMRRSAAENTIAPV